MGNLLRYIYWVVCGLLRRSNGLSSEHPNGNDCGFHHKKKKNCLAAKK